MMLDNFLIYASGTLGVLLVLILFFAPLFLLLKQWVSKRNKFYQDYLSRKEKSRRGPKVTKPNTEIKAVNKDRIY